MRFSVSSVRVAVFSLLLLPAAASCMQEPEPTLAIRNVSVVPMTGDGPLDDQTVLLTNDVISRIGPSAQVEVPDGVPHLDGRGKFLIPGLTDAHVHLMDVADLPLLLAHGVTSVVNMAGAPLQLAWREAINRGELVGPRIFTTGPQLKVTADPLVDFERSTVTAEEAEALVAYQADMGYDFVKIWGPLEPDVYRAVLRVAGNRGIPVVGHIPRDVGLSGVLASGQTAIAHVEEYYNKVFDRTVDPTRLPEVAAQSAAGQVSVVTTLVTYEAIAASVAEDLDPLLARPGRALLDPVRQMLWEPPYNRYRTPGRLGQDGVYLEALEFQGLIARRLHEEGVPLIAGSDAGEIPGLVPGLDLHRELSLLVDAGLTPWEALATATSNSGHLLASAEESFGLVEVGARADLLLLDANPLEDIRNVGRINTTIVRGVPRLPDILLGKVRAANEVTGDFVETVLAAGLPQARRDVMERLSEGGMAPAETPILFLAYALALGGDMETAIGLLGFASEIRPESYMPAYMLGAAALGAGDVDGASAMLERVLELVPGHDGALRMLERDFK